MLVSLVHGSDSQFLISNWPIRHSEQAPWRCNRACFGSIARPGKPMCVVRFGWKHPVNGHRRHIDSVAGRRNPDRRVQRDAASIPRIVGRHVGPALPERQRWFAALVECRRGPIVRSDGANHAGGRGSATLGSLGNRRLYLIRLKTMLGCSNRNTVGSAVGGGNGLPSWRAIAIQSSTIWQRFRYTSTSSSPWQHGPMIPGHCPNKRRGFRRTTRRFLYTGACDHCFASPFSFTHFPISFSRTYISSPS